MGTVTDKQPAEPTNERFVVDYIKSQQFRVVFAEGFLSSATAGNKVHVAFWNSRDAIPQRIEYRVDAKGNVEEHTRRVRADQIREVEVGVLMDIDTALALREFLDFAIAEAQSADDSTDDVSDVTETEERLDEESSDNA